MPLRFRRAKGKRAGVFMPSAPIINQAATMFISIRPNWKHLLCSDKNGRQSVPKKYPMSSGEDVTVSDVILSTDSERRADFEEEVGDNETERLSELMRKMRMRRR